MINNYINKTFQMDNLELLKKLPDNNIDLIYCDILYNTGKKFKDYEDKLGTPQDAIEWYRPRLIEMRRVLSDKGSIYLQCDYRLVHYLKVEMDGIFGIDNFQNDIVWCYKSQGFNRSKWSSKHDNILFYTSGKRWTFNLDDVRENEITESTMKRYGKEINETGHYMVKVKGVYMKGNPFSPPRDWFTTKGLMGANKELVGYDTQKPKALLERIIKASSNEGDIVADFFCGSGTSLVVAKELGRRYIGCDIGEKAVKITNERLNISHNNTIKDEF